MAGPSRRHVLWCAAGGALGLAAASTASASTIAQPVERTPRAFLARAFAMRDAATRSGDQPYGAVVVNASGEIVGEAPSRVVVAGDPTAHAEMEAIRDAARRLGSRDLSGHVIYSSSRPCPMCEAAAHWANLADMVYGHGGRKAGPPALCS